jgi:hypothetical protein
MFIGEWDMQNALKSLKHDSQRKIVLKAGSIFFQGIRVECFVLNISVGGAGLVVEGEIAIPFLFDLEIGEGAIHRRCRVVWRNDRQIGVSFDLDY